MNGSVPPSIVQIGVTLNELNTILSSLPMLQSFHFDARLWNHLKVHHVHIGNNLKTLPPLDHPRQFVMLTKNLTRLYLQGADIFRLHEDHQLLPIFDQTPSLTHLKMDAGGGIWDATYRMLFSMEDMNTLHSKLPFLQELIMDDVVHLMTSKGADETPAMRLRLLRITATCDSHVWFRYISKKYPTLCSLDLNVIPKEDAKEEELVTLVKSLDQLKSLSIHHDMGKLFIGNAFLTLVYNKKLYDLQLGLFAIPSSIRLVGNKLHHLTLSCNKKSNTCYPIQSIFESCPHLVHLELCFGRITEDPTNNKLKSLRMNNVRMSSDTFFHGFPVLESLFLRECIFDGKRVFPIDISLSSMMDTIILSELKVQDAPDKLIFLRKEEEKEVRWYKEMQHRDTYRFHLQRQLLDDVQECHVALGCRSIKSIMFNGCKI
jgi:hypothetical protein